MVPKGKFGDLMVLGVTSVLGCSLVTKVVINQRTLQNTSTQWKSECESWNLNPLKDLSGICIHWTYRFCLFFCVSVSNRHQPPNSEKIAVLERRKCQRRCIFPRREWYPRSPEATAICFGWKVSMKYVGWLEGTGDSHKVGRIKSQTTSFLLRGRFPPPPNGTQRTRCGLNSLGSTSKI